MKCSIGPDSIRRTVCCKLIGQCEWFTLSSRENEQHQNWTLKWLSGAEAVKYVWRIRRQCSIVIRENKKKKSQDNVWKKVANPANLFGNCRLHADVWYSGPVVGNTDVGSDVTHLGVEDVTPASAIKVVGDVVHPRRPFHFWCAGPYFQLLLEYVPRQWSC